MIRIITDGACQGNPGPGGWAVIIVWEDRPSEELGGAEPRTTNNRMELRAAIEGLKRLPHGVEVEVITDSQYLVKGMTEWLAGWKRRDWRASTGRGVENRDLWEELDILAGDRVSWKWVKGHAGDPLNERADQIAQALARGKGMPGACTAETESRPVSGSSAPLVPVGRPPGVSYLSLVGGVLARYRTWPECEARCKGVSGAKYKKCKTLQDEIEAVKSWGLSEKALLKLDGADTSEGPAPGVNGTLQVTILSRPFLSEAERRLIQAGFQKEALTHSSALFRLKAGQAVLEAYTSGKVQVQGIWQDKQMDLWRSVSQTETEWLAANLDLSQPQAVPPPDWRGDSLFCLRGLILSDRLPGWRGELIGRQLIILNGPESIPVAVIGRDQWTREPDEENSFLLWEAYCQSRARPDRWCAAQVQKSSGLALAVLPLTVSARVLAEAWDWKAVKDSPLEDQRRIAEFLREQIDGLVAERWQASAWKTEAGRMGNQLDFVFHWLCKGILASAPVLGLAETWPLELIKIPTGNEDWAHRLVEQRTGERVSYRTPVLDEELRGVEMASFLASYHLSKG